MKQTTKKKADSWAKQMKSRVSERSSMKAQMNQLKKDAKAKDISVYTGWVNSISAFDTSTSVQFCPNAYTSYTSPWPAWAYDLAFQSLLAGKKLMVACDGSPMGDNLIEVVLLKQNVA